MRSRVVECPCLHLFLTHKHGSDDELAKDMVMDGISSYIKSALCAHMGVHRCR